MRRTSVVKGFAFFLLLAGLAVLSFAAKVYLKDGRVLEGEILSFDAYNVTIKGPNLGAITIARSNILKIDPPLEEKKPAPLRPRREPRLNLNGPSRPGRKEVSHSVFL